MLYFLLSRIPLTGAWKTHRTVGAWVREAEDVVRGSGLVPEFHSMLPLTRDPAMIHTIVEVLGAQVKAVIAVQQGGSGEDARAVLREHLPEPFLERLPG